MLAEAGASPEANVAVMRSHGLDDIAIGALLTVTVPDELGARSTLYDRDDVRRAIRDPVPVKPVADAIVADLLVSAGGHPAGARHLAETSGQPASVINLMEERLRRADPGAVLDRRSPSEPRAEPHRRIVSCELQRMGPERAMVSERYCTSIPEPPTPPAA